MIGSWIGSRQNQAISGEQLSSVLGNDSLSGLANSFGVNSDDFAGQLSSILPGLVDKLTPAGQAPAGGLGNTGDLMGALGALLKGRMAAPLIFFNELKENDMGIFSNILAKLGFGSDKVEAAAQKEPATETAAAAPAAPVVKAISVVDVVAHMEALAKAHAEKLNWKVSIVDLMKLLGLDSSLTARKALAVELGCPAEKMGDSAQMNMWLHKTVLQKLADNGGNIPADLL